MRAQNERAAAAALAEKKNVEVQRYGSEDGDKVRIEADEDCLICCKPLVYRAFGPCDHSGICSRCLLTQRLLYGDISCPLCKAENERIIVTSNKSRAHWSSFANSIFGETCGGDLIMDREWGAFFDAADRRHLEDIRALRGFACGVPGCDAKPQTLKALKAHLRSAHDRELCEVCVKAQRKFISEIGRYTSAELQVHLRRGIPSEGFNGHPACPFCKGRYYSDEELYKHMQAKHFSCHICQAQGSKKIYFRDYSALRRHYTSKHFVCMQRECVEKKFVVFATELELQGHMASTHPSIPYKRSINLKFNVGSGSTPQHSDSGATNDDAFDEFAFAYDPSGQISSSSSAVSSTVPAAAAAVRRPRAPVGEEQFPTLGDAIRQSSGSSAPQQHGSASRSWSSSNLAAKLSRMTTRGTQKQKAPPPAGSGVADLPTRVRKALRGNEAQFREFQKLCGKYRKQDINAAEYYLYVSRMFSLEQLDTFFSDLLKLLPQHLRAPLQTKHQEAHGKVSAKAEPQAVEGQWKPVLAHTNVANSDAAFMLEKGKQKNSKKKKKKKNKKKNESNSNELRSLAMIMK
eukprot:g4757.t1